MMEAGGDGALRCGEEEERGGVLEGTDALDRQGKRPYSS